MVERTQAGKLNQNWVCCLMGVPMGWVDPMCPVSVIKNWPRFVSGWLRAQTAQIPSGFSATELSQPPQSELSEFSLGNCGNWTTPNQMDASIAKATLRPSRIATGRKTDYLARQVSMIQEP